MTTLRSIAHTPLAMTALALLSVACDDALVDGGPEGSGTPEPKAVTVLRVANGDALGGYLLFGQESTFVSLEAHIEVGDTQGHALRIHETGDCSGAGFPAVGDHFNPSGSAHGCEGDEDRHAGDLGTYSYEEEAVQVMTAPGATLVDGAASIIGRSLVLYAERDSCAAPDGDGGARIACGVIAWE